MSLLCILPVFGFAREVASVASSEGRTPQDSTALVALDAKVDEYLAALETQPTEVKCTEVDFIIASCTDSTVLTRVANRVYDHYFTSKLMGDEAVAIHIYDTWFADRAVKMGSEDDYFAATFFAAVNRNSLIGRKAPQAQLYTPENEPFTIFGVDNSDGRGDTYNILFFYDIGCPTCLAETVALKNIYERYSGKLNFYAVYVGSDGEKWAEYRRDRFGETSEAAATGEAASIDGSPAAAIIHLWDPEVKSEIAFDYAVIGTPRLFLISPDGTIIGRNLDSVALETLLDIVLAPSTYEYGSQESMEMYDKTFEDESEPCANVSEVAAHIEDMLLPRGDTLLFKQVTGDLLYFLTSRKEARFKCASEDFIDAFILSRPDIWTTADDSLQVVSLGAFVKELLNLCQLGEKLPELEVPVEVLSRKGKIVAEADETAISDAVESKTTTLRLDKQKNCVVMFYSTGCGLCAQNLQGARNILATGVAVPNTALVPSKIILIDMDEIWLDGGDLPDRLMESFDLSTLPFIVCLDSKGRVAYKYADLR